MRPAPWIRFSLFVFSGALSIWAGLALWIAAAPLTVLEGDRVVAIATSTLLRQCDPARVIVMGDSRAIFGIDPLRIDVPVVNLSEGNANPILDYYRLRTRLECPAKPDLVVLSYILPEYVRLDDNGLWTNGAASHKLPFFERREIVAAIEAANDPASLVPMAKGRQAPYQELPISLKDILYQLYFPPFYGAAILNTQRIGFRSRLEINRRIHDSILAARGHLDARMQPKWTAAALDAGLSNDGPHPVIDAYLQRMLALLAEHHIPSMLMVMPVNDATYTGIPVQVREGLMRYLQSLVERYPLVSLADRDLPNWPDQYFGDGYVHLNPMGAAEVAAILNACLPAQLKQSEPSAGARCSLAMRPR